MQTACISQLYTSHRGLLLVPWAANVCQQCKHRKLSQCTPKIKSRESRTRACQQLLLFSPAPSPCGFQVYLPGLCLSILTCAWNCNLFCLSLHDGNWEISIAPSQLIQVHVTIQCCFYKWLVGDWKMEKKTELGREEKYFFSTRMIFSVLIPPWHTNYSHSLGTWKVEKNLKHP